MRAYRVYHCDYGHHWTVVTRQGEPERDDEVRCPEGHEAVTCNEELPSDEVQILIRPAARIADKVTGSLRCPKRYFLVLLDRTDQEICGSIAHYSRDEVVQLAAQFRGKDLVRAREWWKRKGL
jgi:hypothetical protein